MVWSRVAILSAFVLLAAQCSNSNPTGAADGFVNTPADGSINNPQADATVPSDGSSGDGMITSGPMLHLLAGNSDGPGNANGIGTAARFNQPLGIALDSAGNAFIADEDNYLIRKIVLSTNTVSTIAGGAFGTANGVGTAAQFKLPSRVASDDAGNLFVSDGSAIRQIVTGSKSVTTLAGSATAGAADGTGALAAFAAGIGDLAADGSGNLYVSDSGNHVIRKIIVATGVVSTIAGSLSSHSPGTADGTGSAASFYSPSNVALDGSGNLYVADSGNHTIRKIVLATAAVSTIAGSGASAVTDGSGASAAFQSIGGLAYDGAGHLVLSEAVANTLRTLTLATNGVTTIAGQATSAGTINGVGSAARFSLPEGIASDKIGNLYVADARNHEIRKVVEASATVSTIAGSAPQIGTTNGTAALFDAPSGITADTSGNLYVADNMNATIRMIAIASGAVTTIAGAPGTTGTTDGPGSAARFDFPNSVTFDGSGNLYIADTMAQTIRRLSLSTNMVTTVASQINRPTQITLDNSGNLYVVASHDHTVREVAMPSAVVTTLAGNAGVQGSADGTGIAATFNYPTGIAFDGSDSLYVSDTQNLLIRKIVIATQTVSTVAGQVGSPQYLPITTDGMGTTATFAEPTQLCISADNLYIADSVTLRKMVLANATVSTLAGNPTVEGFTPGALPSTLDLVNGVAVLPSGEFAVSSAESIVIYK